MTRTSKMALLSLAAVAMVGFSVSAVTPAYAKSGLGPARPTIQCMMKNGSQFHANTRQEATKQLAKDPAVFSDTSDKAVRVYELAPSENGIVRRRTVPN